MRVRAIAIPACVPVGAVSVGTRVVSVSVMTE